jgi:hypothetical protein
MFCWPSLNFEFVLRFYRQIQKNVERGGVEWNGKKRTLLHFELLQFFRLSPMPAQDPHKIFFYQLANVKTILLNYIN